MIVQLVPALHIGDAIGNNAIAIRDYLKSIGCDTQILCLEMDAGLELEAEFATIASKYDHPDTIWILHYALPSPLNLLFKTVQGYKILVYHNITPAHFLCDYKILQRIAVEGRRQLKELADVTDRSLADSEFNRKELQEYGFKNTAVMPIFIDFNQLKKKSNPVLEKMFDDDFVNILFVGRITPNKCQHELLKFYGFYKRFVRERSRLFLVGKYNGFEKYYTQIIRIGEKLKLGDIYITGRVSQQELVTYYRLADVFLSFSEHEGFGVPFVESMFMNVPILAYDCTAVPFTLKNAGIRFRDKTKMSELSEMIDLIIKDKHFQSKILSQQRARLKYFMPENLHSLWGNEILQSKK